MNDCKCDSCVMPRKECPALHNNLLIVKEREAFCDETYEDKNKVTS